MTDLKEQLEIIRDRWKLEQPIYGQLGKYISNTLSENLARKGVYARITSRPKDMISMLKKVVRKQYDSPYEKIVDKTGVRVVVLFAHQLEIVDQLVKDIFEILERDDKKDILGTNTLGYQAIHYQVKLIGESMPTEFQDKSCEIQARTVCQDTWSEMAHSVFYKTEMQIPGKIERRIHCLSGLLEVADVEFEQIHGLIQSLPHADTIKMINMLEKFAFGLQGCLYDRTLSVIVIECLKKSYSADEISNLAEILDSFVKRNYSRLREMIEMYKDQLVFVTQPEIILILERLETNKYILEEQWCLNFPDSALREIAIAWGVPLD
jgi:putative GTP pyrophosphokinase